MKRIYWCLPQLTKIGGTEEVSIDLMNALADDYDITLISSSKIDDKVAYYINPKIKVTSLNIPSKLARYDQYSLIYLRKLRLLKAIGLTISTFHHYLFKRHHYRKTLEKLIVNDPSSVLIASALDSYLLAPKKGNVYFHYHYNSKLFFSFGERFTRLFSRKPDKFIFLSKTTMNEIVSKKPKLKDKSVYINNPCRFESFLDTDYHHNSIIFAGRYSNQKDPMKALRVAKKLKDEKFKFTMRLFGQGALEADMKNYVKFNHLEKQVFINKTTDHLEEELKNSDILLITSLYEGFSLIRAEASAYSCPCISTYWGEITYDFIQDGQNGYVVKSNKAEDLADCIKSTLSNKEALAELKRKTYESSKKYSIANIIPLWKELLGN